MAALEYVASASAFGKKDAQFTDVIGNDVRLMLHAVHIVLGKNERIRFIGLFHLSCDCGTAHTGTVTLSPDDNVMILSDAFECVMEQHGQVRKGTMTTCIPNPWNGERRNGNDGY